MGDNIRTVGDSFSTVEVLSTLGGYLKHMRADNINIVGDNISTVEGIQYSGGRVLISACLTIKND